ncbi:MAG: DUF1801 domain-containing protein [Bacteroidales bacterium]|nr:DUF1801 domain-containing protein [Bacteroidales bacterium]MCF8390491.1 DUF1801 domain-containing protein [Bacteroidales bacterium]
MNEVEQYITNFPSEVQVILKKIRALIKKTAPDAVENIAYGMPAYKINAKPLVYFAAFKNHIGLYALPSGNVRFTEELSKYKHGKGSIQFPLDKPVPYDLIEQIVLYRLSENLSKPDQSNHKALKKK